MDKYDTSEYKVTYLLGAGASAEVLPTVKGKRKLTDSFIELAGELLNYSNTNPEYHDLVIPTIDNLKWLAEGSDKYGTPDTFAKFLYLKDRTNLNRLKQTLSFYFTAEQLVSKKMDKRALVFLVTVMQINAIFPSNIRVITWNYDFQLQLAALEFKEENYIDDKSPNNIKVDIHSPPLINYYPALGSETRVNYAQADAKEFSMVHLNGIAGFFYDNKTRIFRNDYLKQNINSYSDLIKKTYDEGGHQRQSLITFAWEKDTKEADLLNMRINRAKAAALNTDILVVIGYSFPFFNREIDAQIFEALKRSSRLKKIYFQDPYLDGSFLAKQFELPDSVEIIHIKEKDNYYVPKEL